MKSEELKDLLNFEAGLVDVKIIESSMVNDECEFVKAILDYGDSDMVVAFVYWVSDRVLFTPWDWQGSDFADFTSADIATIDWREGNSTSKAIVLGGLPRLF